MPLHSSVGPLLKEWRSHRRMSQLALASAAEVSQRHISFVESGRSTPSRELLLHLARVLDIPLRDQNTLLTAAGYASVFTEHDYDEPDLAPLRTAITTMLRGVDPYPAMAIDRLWNVRDLNEGAGWLVEALDIAPAVLGDPPNLLQACLHPDGARSALGNWPEVASVLVDRVERDALLNPTDQALADLMEEMRSFPGVAELDRRPLMESPPRFSVEVELELAGGSYRFFTAMTTVGAPTDITTQELAIEFWFPADEATEQALRSR